jgi:inorganic triphosphatase YgiF
MLGAMEVPAAAHKPERRRAAVILLKRIAVAALLAAVALVGLPRLLGALGVIGPSAAERIAAAERTLAAAGSYGATDALPAYASATRELAQARQRLAEGRGHDARAAADRALAEAIDAQRAALIESEQLRRRAQAVVDELDDRVNALEDRYDKITPGLSRPAVAALLSSMKETRQAAGAVFLAWEQQQPRRVLAGEPAARRAIEATERVFAAAAPASAPAR